MIKNKTATELLHFYNSLLKSKKNKYSTTNIFSKGFQKKRKIFEKLVDLLNDQDIPPEEYILCQFKGKGYTPYPSQLLSTKALDRWYDWKSSYDAKGIHNQQLEYLKRLKEIGYSTEDALSLDIFFYYFRRLYLKDVPKVWDLYAEKEINLLPGLKTFLERTKNDFRI